MPLNKEIEKQIAENNQKISALLAENENLLRCAGLNPPAANAALPPEKKIQFPSGYIRTVGHFKFRYHLSEIFPTKATRHNVTYALEVSDLMNYIVNRINIWGPVEVIFYKRQYCFYYGINPIRGSQQHLLPYTDLWENAFLSFTLQQQRPQLCKKRVGPACRIKPLAL